MATTTKGFPYPTGTDVPNVAQHIQNLATSLDAFFSPLRCSVWKTTGPSLAQNWTGVSWTDVDQNATMWVNTDPTKILLPKIGVWRIESGILFGNFAAASTVILASSIQMNGIAADAASTSGHYLKGAQAPVANLYRRKAECSLELTVPNTTTYIQTSVYQNSGVTQATGLTIPSGNSILEAPEANYMRATWLRS